MVLHRPVETAPHFGNFDLRAGFALWEEVIRGNVCSGRKVTGKSGTTERKPLVVRDRLAGIRGNAGYDGCIL